MHHEICCNAACHGVCRLRGRYADDFDSMLFSPCPPCRHLAGGRRGIWNRTNLISWSGAAREDYMYSCKEIAERPSHPSRHHPLSRHSGNGSGWGVATYTQATGWHLALCTRQVPVDWGRRLDEPSGTWLGGPSTCSPWSSLHRLSAVPAVPSERSRCRNGVSPMHDALGVRRYRALIGPVAQKSAAALIPWLHLLLRASEIDSNLLS